MKCESSQYILQKCVQGASPTKELAAQKTKQPESSKEIVSNMEGITIIQALEMEAHKLDNVVYKDLAEIVGHDEIRLPEKPIQNDKIAMDIIRREVLDEQREESEPDHDLKVTIQDQDSSDNVDDMGESEQQQIVILYCEKCSNTFENMEEFDAHSTDCEKVQMVNWQTGKRLMRKCQHCSTYFVNKRSLENHISKCQSSQKATGTQDSLIHDTKSPPEPEVVYRAEFACKRCGAKFNSDKSFHFHMKTNKCTTPQFVCKICGKVFINDKYLSEHLKAHENAFMCLRCESTFSSEKELKEHTKNKHVGVLKNECRLCGKVFIMLSTLEAHFRIHNGETPFICSICGKRCLQDTSLKQHVMLHENHKSYECNQCGSFVSIEKFIGHLRKHTGDLPFVCNICNAAFKQPGSLSTHKRNHTGERPFACDLCPKRFGADGILKSHRRTHSGEKPYCCSFCPRAFTTRTYCRTHMRNHPKLHDKDQQKQTKMAAMKVIKTKDEEEDTKDQEIIETKIEDDKHDL